MTATIESVGKKAKGVADLLYNGDIYGHVTEIYNLLNEEEKKIFLNSSITNLMGAAGSPDEVEKGANSMYRSEKDMRIQMEIAELSALNELEMLELKRWLFKAITVAVLLVIGIGSLGLVFTGVLDGEIENLLYRVGNIFRTMFFS